MEVTCPDVLGASRTGADELATGEQQTAGCASTEGFWSVSGEAWKAKRLLLFSEQPRSFLGARADAGCHVADAHSTKA